MRIFSDELREWGSYTYEVFVPVVIRSKVYDLTHHVTYLEKDEVGEFELVTRRFSDELESVTFVPDVEPVRSYSVPFEVLNEALAATSAEEVENILIGAGEYGVLMEEE